MYVDKITDSIEQSTGSCLVVQVVNKLLSVKDKLAIHVIMGKHSIPFNPNAYPHY